MSAPGRPPRRGASVWGVVAWLNGLALFGLVLAGWLCLHLLVVAGFRWDMAAKLAGVVAAAAFVTWALCSGRREPQVSTAILLSLLLLAGQVLLRPERVSRWPAGLLRAPAPYVMFTGQPGVSGHNALGYVGDLPVLPKPAGERRIFVLGGSTVYQGLPALLERELRAGWRRPGEPRVYNWGVVSAGSGQEVATLVHRALAFQPDLVVFYDGGNDVASPWSYDPRPDHPFNYLLEERAVRLFQDRDALSWVAATFVQSHALALVFAPEIDEASTRRTSLARDAGRGTASWEERAIASYLRNHDVAKALARGAGFEVAFCLQPLVVDKGAPTSEEAGLLSGLGADMSAYLRRQYDRLRAAWSERSARAEVRTAHLDLSRIFAAGHPEQVFTDFVHLTAEADGVVARALAAGLRDAGLLGSR